MDKNCEKENRYVQFKLGLKDYLLDISCMEEVIGAGKIVEIPDCPVFVKGVTRFRTQVITVVSINQKMGIEESIIDDKAKIMVVKYKNEKIGIIIDRLVGIKTQEEIATGVHGKPEEIDIDQIIRN